jgi:D-alanyl-D-alanine carboxypeptidase/D-alanyl-D-alanine-endopeptidase (penicillin-binding protein 4)
MLRLKKSLLFFALSMSFFAFSQGPFATIKTASILDFPERSSDKSISAKEEVDFEINKMMSDPVLKNADWGLLFTIPLLRK